jgi:integrase/recombinase XerD
MRLRAAVSDYLANQETRGDSVSHRKECARILGSFLGRLGDLALEDIQASELRDFLAEVRRRPGRKNGQVSEHTVKAYHRTLAAFFRHLASEALLATNPMARVPKPKLPQELVRPFSEEQLRRLLAQPDPHRFTGLRDRTLMCLLLDTGARISECLSLRLQDVDLEQRVLRVYGKGGRERIVPFGERTAEWLERYLARRCESIASDYLFINQFGERLLRTSVAKRFAVYGRRAGIEGVRVSPHTFRHTFGVK